MLKARQGFTLIELLIVVVIIGILAAIAIPKFGQTREKAYYSAMKSDLRNLQSAQEVWYSANNYTYNADVATLTDYAMSSGVTVTVETGDQVGWSAIATHSAFANDAAKGCGIQVGDLATHTASIVNGTAVAGVVTCVGE
jgi:prepilin-type N-terminal cleavage/methylation domain-containing protein